MSSSHSPSGGSLAKCQTELSSSSTATDLHAVLVREAGVPFRLPSSDIDPFEEWLSLMEVVQMLCPIWPARHKPCVGKEWLL